MADGLMDNEDVVGLLGASLYAWISLGETVRYVTCVLFYNDQAGTIYFLMWALSAINFVGRERAISFCCMTNIYDI